MKLAVRKENEITFVTINSERATLVDAPEFRETLLDLIENKNSRKIVVDFDGVEFVDSTFLSALVVGLKKITEKMGDIKVANLESPVRVMFELTRLYKVFEVFDNKLDAVESF
ncbi:MAG: STAS domain-containing protein [Ignavibacteria bacterium]|jgi:anti-anti-sigma factor|nr:STAS domain-containing protein [Ignavibacteria bacterium]